ncbi:hypothetical protein HON01_05010 [Candidatus Woesearchaeota archaeon]|nr:hypothetical protein [Candidatus Woesearchaeota archaeon]
MQKYKNLAIVPILTSDFYEMDWHKFAEHNPQHAMIFGEFKRDPINYLTLEEALKENVLEIHETGNVNNLEVRNKSGKEILVVKGEYVIGGKQNRMITVNAMLDPNAKRIQIPVHCVEQGRWSRPGTFQAQMRRVSTAPSSLRSKTMKSFSGQSGQNQTWCGVSEVLGDVGVRSNSSDCDQAFEGRKEDISDVVKKFTYFKDKQVGCVAAVNTGQETYFFVDMFDQPKTMEQQYERLITSYAIDSLRYNTDSVKFSKADGQKLVNELMSADPRVSNSLSLGKDVELEKGHPNEIYGAALVHKDVMVYLGANIKLDSNNNRTRMDGPNRNNNTNHGTPRNQGSAYTTGNSMLISRGDLFRRR